MDLNPKHLEERYDKEMASMVHKAGDLLRSKYGLWFLGIMSMADSALGLPITMDPFMAAYIVANRAKAFWGFLVTALGSVLGGVMAYFLAEFFIEQILGHFSPHTVHLFNHLVDRLDQGSFTFAFLGAFTPVPYTFIAIVAGALKVNLAMFIAGSILGRAIRYGLVAYFVYRFGERAAEIAKKNILVTSFAIILVIGGYIVFELSR